MKLLLSLFNRADAWSPYRGILSLFLQRRRQIHIHTSPADPRWQILNRWVIPWGSSANVVADDKTATECRTSSGRPLHVSVAATAPPAISFISVDPSGNTDEESADADNHCYVIAAHGDSVLFRRSKVPLKEIRGAMRGWNASPCS
ncbi:hypothetical protein HU200_035981 [Digitaria exilis]|uniref:Uncharacterized protein n=1 Tax=Digitaria exilis TaxID=1010633 RepID=A0A835EIJ3_9POAL|nr:hypothetical protein HU200_035981 [Digitaria exilis]